MFPRQIYQDTDHFQAQAAFAIILCEEEAYFSGVVAETERGLDAAIRRARASPVLGEPLFRGELEVLCLAD